MNKGRIIEEHKTRYTISTTEGMYSAVVRGLFHRGSTPQRMYPKVGDYVEYTKTSDTEVVIENILPRKTEVSRAVLAKDFHSVKVSSEVIVVNVDIIFIVVGLDNDFNVSRVERYALLAKQSNIDAVILLNKSDEVDNPDAYIEQIKQTLSTIPIHAISAENGTNMEIIKSYIKPKSTAVLLGSSGVGKSTITNWLIGEQKQTTGAVRKKDSRGKHTTTARQLFTIPTGGYLIDTPGIRELGVMSTKEVEAETFTDIEALSQQCKFNKCDHAKTEGCAILNAIENGDMEKKHLENYLKIQNERERSTDKGNSSQKYDDKKRKSNTVQKNRKNDRNFNSKQS